MFKTSEGSAADWSQLTEPQIILYNWLKFYDWLFGPDGPKPPPPQEIIDNDDELDAFLDEWKKSLSKPSKPDK